MNNFINITILIFSVIIFIFSLAIFIDRSFLSNTGFSGLFNLYSTYFFLAFSISLSIYELTITWPNIFATSSVLIIISSHLFLFFFINFIIIAVTNIVLYTDYYFKKRKVNFKILTNTKVTYNTFLKNKSFIKVSLIISYMLCTIFILFYAPSNILNNFLGNHDLTSYVSKEIKLYQQLFVFSTIPILLSLLKKTS